MYFINIMEHVALTYLNSNKFVVRFDECGYKKDRDFYYNSIDAVKINRKKYVNFAGFELKILMNFFGILRFF